MDANDTDQIPRKRFRGNPREITTAVHEQQDHLGRSLLAHRALSVVLQQLMFPDPGWYTNSLELYQLTLRKEIIQKRVDDYLEEKKRNNSTRFSTNNTNQDEQELETMKQNWEEALESDFITFAYDDIANTVAKFHNFDINTLIEEPLTVSTCTLLTFVVILILSHRQREDAEEDGIEIPSNQPMPELFYSDDFEKGLRTMYETFFMPPLRLLHHQSISFTYIIHQTHKDMLLVLTTLFSRQREKFPRIALIANQLSGFMQWKHSMEGMEHASLCFSLTPSLIQALIPKVGYKSFINQDTLPTLLPEYNGNLLFTRVELLENLQESKDSLLEEILLINQTEVYLLRSFHDILDPLESTTNILRQLVALYDSELPTTTLTASCRHLLQSTRPSFKHTSLRLKERLLMQLTTSNTSIMNHLWITQIRLCKLLLLKVNEMNIKYNLTNSLRVKLKLYQRIQYIIFNHLSIMEYNNHQDSILGRIYKDISILRRLKWLILEKEDDVGIDHLPNTTHTRIDNTLNLLIEAKALYHSIAPWYTRYGRDTLYLPNKDDIDNIGIANVKKQLIDCILANANATITLIRFIHRYGIDIFIIPLYKSQYTYYTQCYEITLNIVNYVKTQLQTCIQFALSNCTTNNPNGTSNGIDWVMDMIGEPLLMTYYTGNEEDQLKQLELYLHKIQIKLIINYELNHLLHFTDVIRDNDNTNELFKQLHNNESSVTGYDLLAQERYRLSDDCIDTLITRQTMSKRWYRDNKDIHTSMDICVTRIIASIEIQLITGIHYEATLYNRQPTAMTLEEYVISRDTMSRFYSPVKEVLDYLLHIRAQWLHWTELYPHTTSNAHCDMIVIKLHITSVGLYKGYVISIDPEKWGLWTNVLTYRSTDTFNADIITFDLYMQASKVMTYIDSNIVSDDEWAIFMHIKGSNSSNNRLLTCYMYWLRIALQLDYLLYELHVWVEYSLPLISQTRLTLRTLFSEMIKCSELVIIVKQSLCDMYADIDLLLSSTDQSRELLHYSESSERLIEGLSDDMSKINEWLREFSRQCREIARKEVIRSFQEKDEHHRICEEMRTNSILEVTILSPDCNYVNA